jgi:hypothetical protein
MSGIAAVLCNDSARYSLFWACWNRLQMPPGWRQEALIGGDWCGARNKLCQMVLDSDAKYLWFMDDDHAFSPDILHRLLAHEKDLVVPVCFTRSAPFPPVDFVERVGDDRYLPVYLPEMPPSGLVQLAAGGTAGMLIHRSVIEALDGPEWFEYGAASEDILFCNKAIDAGFELYCDLGTRLGHITTAVVEPAFVDGEWTVGTRIGSYGAMTNVLLPIESSRTSEKVLA